MQRLKIWGHWLYYPSSYPPARLPLIWLPCLKTRQPHRRRLLLPALLHRWNPTPAEKNILTLGDSYTIGTRVRQDERWPVQLAAALRGQGIPVAEPLIIAQGGWTTGDLADGIRAANPQGTFDLVTLLIGVNDQFRGNTVGEYRPGFIDLLAQAGRVRRRGPRARDRALHTRLECNALRQRAPQC